MMRVLNQVKEKVIKNQLQSNECKYLIRLFVVWLVLE